MAKYTPLHLSLWSRAENYAGDDFTDYYTSFGHSAASSLLEESNFEYAKRVLKAGKLKTVRIVKFSHWAVGWVEGIMIHRNAPKHILKLADDLAKRYEEYPVLDESDYSQRQVEAAAELWQSMGLRERIRLVAEKNKSKFSARKELREQSDDVFDYVRELATE